MPVIPNQVFYVTNYGAVGNGVTTNTAAIQNAINAASASSLHGGTVEITAGTFLSGPLTLASSVNLQLDQGAMLRALPYGRYPGGTSPPNFINGSSLHDVEISGAGTMDGQGADWWPGYKTNSRPYLVNLSSCARVLIQGITFLNAPAQNLVIKGRGGNVTIQDATFSAPSSSDPINPSHNTDAMDLAETNCLIQNCYLDVGDDNVALGSSSSVTADILITNCTCGNGHGISIGSNTAGGVSNVTVINCTFNGTDNGIRMKSDNDRGGLVQNISYLNLGMTNIGLPIVIYSYYNQVGTPNNISPATAAGETVAAVSGTTPIWRNVLMSNVTATVSAGGTAGIIWGRTEMPVTNVTMAKINISAPKTFDLYNAYDVRVLDSQFSVPSSAKTLTLYNTGVTFSNATSGAGQITLAGMPGDNSVALYRAPASLSDPTALGANPITVSGCTLAISNDLNLSSDSVINFEAGADPATIAVGGTLALAGTLNVSAGPGIGIGTYTLFTYNQNLNWGQVALGTTPFGFNCALDTNTIGQVNLILHPLSSLTPVSLQLQVSSGQLGLTWPADHIGWQLQCQTNAAGQGLSSNWITVAGSRQTNHIALPADPASGSVFLRLAYP